MANKHWKDTPADEGENTRNLKSVIKRMIMLDTSGFNEIDISCPVPGSIKSYYLGWQLGNINLKAPKSYFLGLAHPQEEIDEVKRNQCKVPLLKMAKRKTRQKRKLAVRDWLNELFPHCYLKSGFQTIFKYFRKGS